MFAAKERLKFKGNEELLWSLKQLEETSTRTGLQPEHIVSLVDVAASGQQGNCCILFRPCHNKTCLQGF